MEQLPTCLQLSKEFQRWLGAFAHDYNPRYSGGRYQKDHVWGQSGQEVSETPSLSISINKLNVLECTCYPQYTGDVNKSITVQTGLGKKILFEKITKPKRAYQAGCSEFCTTKNNNNNNNFKVWVW
jgi:hypothetical protein